MAQPTTETMLIWLRAAIHNAQQLYDHVDRTDATARVICRHVLRDLQRVEGDLDAALDKAAFDAVEERYALTVSGLLALAEHDGAT